MNDQDKIFNALLNEVRGSLNEKRLLHTENVLEKAMDLSDKYGGDKDRAKIIALAHDRFRDIDDAQLAELINYYSIDERYKGNNALAHGPVAAEYIRDKYGVEDEDVLNGIRYHTTGRENMSLLEKIVFLADAIEKDRDYPGVDLIRSAAEKSLDHGVKECLQNTVDYLEKKKKSIDKDTVDALKYYEAFLEGKSK